MRKMVSKTVQVGSTPTPPATFGALAQLVERLNGIEKVWSSNLQCSTFFWSAQFSRATAWIRTGRVSSGQVTFCTVGRSASGITLPQ